MKTLLTALLAASALAPSVAHAQRFGAAAGVGVREGRPDRPDRADQPQVRAQADVDAHAGRVDPAREGIERRDDRRDFRNERRDDRQDFARERQEDRRNLRDGDVTPRQFRDERRESRQDYRADRREDRQQFGVNRRDDRQDYRANLRDDRQDYRADTRDLRRDAAQGRPGWQNYSAFRGQSGFDRRHVDRGAWNRGWRDNARYDWNRYRSVNRGAYRLPRYYAPSGWGYGYRRFSIGVTLSAGLWDQNYWIDDPYAYRLPEAYGPYRWVRYYDDALLIDIRSGRVVDTVYGIFY